VKVISTTVAPQNTKKKEVIETIASFTIHLLLVALAIIECKIATSNNLAAVIVAAVAFVAVASFENLYGPLIGYDHQGFTCASFGYLFGQFINWIWCTCWPSDFEGLSTTIPLAITFVFISFAIQMIMLWEDLKG
jgi:hypothetical protein